MGDWAATPDAQVRTDGGAVAVAPRGPPAELDAAPVRPSTITIPPTPDGVATALSHLSAAHATMGPERSHPSRRGRPPLVAFGETDVPRAVREATPETGIAIRLPPSFEHLFVAAPLAYYLGADVSVEAGARPVLAAPEADLSRRLDPPPSFARDVAALVRRCLFLDALVRDLPGERLAGRRGLCRSLAVRADRLRSLEPARRLDAYLDVDGVEPHLPRWHLSTYVEPAPARARSLPHLLDAMSLIYPPESTELDARERLQRSLEDFYRTRTEVPSVEVVSPSLAEGDLHGWLAEGTPIEAYKTSHSAYRNGLRHRERSGEDCRLAVVVNDDRMASERTVADIYRERSSSSALDVSVHAELRREELASVFEQPHDFVHYIGHCEVDGLACPDGHLAAADLEDVRTHTFFLNACGSFHQGRALVEAGSTAGAVTLSAVLDEQAATVGRTFARLVVSGFSVAAALDLARRRIMMGKDYAVVGDGTTAAVESDRTPAVLYVSESGDGRYDVRHEVSAPRGAGASHADPFRPGARLAGARARATLETETLRTFLEGRSLPVVHEGQFVWAEDLAARL